MSIANSSSVSARPRRKVPNPRPGRAVPNMWFNVPPAGSASTATTRLPTWARYTAMLAASKDFPAPPRPEAMAMIVGKGCWSPVDLATFDLALLDPPYELVDVGEGAVSTLVAASPCSVGVTPLTPTPAKAS